MSSKGTIKRIVSDKGFGFVADDWARSISSISRRASRSTRSVRDRP